MKAKLIRQSDLTSECWTIQMWGIEACKDCEALNTKECGGARIREQIARRKYPTNGLPNQETSEQSRK